MTVVTALSTTDQLEVYHASNGVAVQAGDAYVADYPATVSVIDWGGAQMR